MNTELSPAASIDQIDRQNQKPALIRCGFYGVLVSGGLILLSGVVIHAEMQYTLARDEDAITMAALVYMSSALGFFLSMLSILAGCIVSAIREAST